ncbi:MAG: bifunctional UDP-N-acetylmuramoyl-tripeptide:D-alanyl-D-alanine ligase/alanine racemase [Chlorobi bacterium]|nr:bifunctional UDP-N-acetylmuramoyl-tripeptide:D-alanyl-D-alanine ligase/alanine racemase [Chlorobiota bacterium]
MVHRIYNGKELTEILGARLVSPDANRIAVKDILIDSRRLITPEQCLFFALVSKRNDGHQYIPELYGKGMRFFVVSTLPEKMGEMPKAHFFLVDNTLAALQKLAAWHRKLFDIPVIGITGSNGKTIVKEWLFQLLSPDRKIIRSPKSYNSQIGVPLSVWQINDDHEIAIIEAGISEPDEMENLRMVINPTIGLFTNIGQAHDENFISTAQKIGEKLKLFTKVETLIYNADRGDIQEILIRSGILEYVQTFCWGKDESSDLRITGTEPVKQGTLIRGRYKDDDYEINIPFHDKASIENAIHCWAVMLFMGYNQKVISDRMLNLSPVAMRLELKEGINNCTIINDSYNSDFNSLSIALDFLNQQTQHKQKTLILSDILQSGRNEDDLYKDVARLVEQKNIDQIIGIGPAISRQKNQFNIPKSFYQTTAADFLSLFPLGSLSNQTILLKGARIFEFEQISRRLQQKLHETVLEINLDALVENLNYFRSKIPSGTKIMAMVKAFSYGSGGFEIANILQFHHIDYLAVAYADEGVELRKSGVTLPIMVMNPEEYAFDTMIKYQLEPEIFSFRALDMLVKSILRSAIPQNKPVKIHIKLETGMNRLGFTENEIEELILRLKKNPLIYVQSVFSHLAASDKPDLDDFTNEQIRRFSDSGKRIVDAFNHKVLMHILNSAGIIRFPEYSFDMVRLGIGLYGIPSVESDRDKLNPATRLRSVIAQIKEVKKGESVGYNRSFISEKDMPVGIVSIGYADGLLRSLGNGKASLYINGKEAPIIGDICMDMCMIDLSGIEAREGDDVIIFDREHPVTDLARIAGTIPYEILSRISRRVKRVYFHE